MTKKKINDKTKERYSKMLVYMKKFYKSEYKYSLIKQRLDTLTDKVIETLTVN